MCDPRLRLSIPTFLPLPSLGHQVTPAAGGCLPARNLQTTQSHGPGSPRRKGLDPSDPPPGVVG